jgi:steroid delta-isomerase-like uncharacterized protein
MRGFAVDRVGPPYAGIEKVVPKRWRTWHNCDGRCPLTSATTTDEKRSARIATVEQHIRLENQHDLEGVLSTFGDTARYDDEPWDEHYDGPEGVRRFYNQLMRALPDLEIEVRQRHVAHEAILVEVMIRGTHLGGWKGLPATGRRVELPLCGIYTFDADDRLAAERILRSGNGAQAARRVP